MDEQSKGIGLFIMIEAIVGQPTDIESLKTAALADLRVFLRSVDARGELERVDGASADGEIGALFDLSCGHLYPPVLLFENIPGYDPRFRIVTNVLTSKLLVGDLTLDALKAYRKRPKESATKIPPEVVDHGPVLENAIFGDAIDLHKYPAPKWKPDDGGRYIGTECMVIMKDPDTNWLNTGTYRVMVHDEKTLGMYIEPGQHGDFIRRKYWAAGKACPVAISVGQAPILSTWAATSTNEGESEYEFAGARIGRPIRVVPGRETGLPIPADAELVFEGFMPPPEEETRLEGPFGEWPGYYASIKHPEPVIRVKAVYHRNDPIICGNPPLTPMHPGQQFKLFRLAAAWDALEAAGVPGVTGLWKVLGGGSRFIDVISIKQQFPGHAKMTGLVSAGTRAGSHMNRVVIIVDDDIDITVPAEVMWALATRWDPKTQTDIIDGCWSGGVDPLLSPEKRASGEITTSRMIVYAVRPYHWKDEFPKVNTIPKAYANEIRSKWSSKLKFLQ